MVDEKKENVPEKEEPTEREEEVFVATGVFQNERVLVTGPGASILFNTGFYGELRDQDTLILSDVEVTNLIERKRLVVLDEETNLPLPLRDVANHFAMKNSNYWVKYLVYKDLRMRGYVVRIGFEDPVLFRVYPRGGQPGRDPAKLFVAPMVEGKRLALETLEHLFSIALSARKQLLLAVIDRSGDVTYYRAQEIDL